MENETNNNRRHVRRVVVLMTIISLLPVIGALLLYANPQWIDQYKNYGTLITPPVQWEANDLKPVGDFSQQNFDELDDRWVLMHLFAADDMQCNTDCTTDIHNSRQLWLMLNNNLMRTRRVVAFSSVQSANTYLTAKQQARMAREKNKKIGDDDAETDEFLLYAIASQRFRAAILQAVPNPEPGMILLRDPLGNVMLWYGAKFDPKKVKKDLTRLFRTSRVG